MSSTASSSSTERTYNVLFLCTKNAARSIMAEAILNRHGAGRFRAFSAGTHPAESVHPLTLVTLSRLGYDTTGLAPKSWHEFEGFGVPRLDFVFTVCDDAAGEDCPVWPGHPMTAHWGIENPARVEGSEMEKEAAFSRAYNFLKNRITVFDNLPIDTLDRLALQSRLMAIGHMDGASPDAKAD
ncbi:arsenate reductase ArsC [Xanthobacter sp. TB0139]|uniref:arsenate reductase ArsC n=1 Tax=Xanthobacter sp. TB0139 TaxID=3459178 RepID=UPI0040397810